MSNKLNYFAKRNELCFKALNHTIEMEKYKQMTKESIQNSTIYHEFNRTNIEKSSIDKESKIMFYNLDSVETAYQAVRWLDSGKVCILNFASYKNPGGKFIDGSSAQEECLCHHSNLYNILKEFKNDFYKPNSKKLNNALYHSNLIYTPNVVFEFFHCVFNCDVITCAAPNKKAAQKYKNIPDKIVWNHMYDRIDHVLYAAYSKNVDTLILGAFGCGVFGNNPHDVAEIFKDLIMNKYYKSFKNIIFGIPTMHQDDNTLKIFQNVFDYKVTESPIVYVVGDDGKPLSLEYNITNENVYNCDEIYKTKELCELNINTKKGD